MSDTIGIIGAGVGAVQTPTSVARAQVVDAASTSFSSAVSAVSSNTTAASSASFVSKPVVIQDPSVGFITEYLSANGSQVVSQTPTAITVAYLRLGLTAEGTRKEPNQVGVSTTA